MFDSSSLWAILLLFSKCETDLRMGIVSGTLENCHPDGLGCLIVTMLLKHTEHPGIYTMNPFQVLRTFALLDLFQPRSGIVLQGDHRTATVSLHFQWHVSKKVKVEYRFLRYRMVPRVPLISVHVLMQVNRQMPMGRKNTFHPRAFEMFDFFHRSKAIRGHRSFIDRSYSPADPNSEVPALHRGSDGTFRIEGSARWAK